MTIANLTKSETEAVMYLTQYEVVKVAADKRCVSEHTEKNQLKSAMSKLGVCTQVGLVKEFFLLIYGVKFELKDARQMIAVCLLALFIFSIGNNALVSRRARMRRAEYEEIIDMQN